MAMPPIVAADPPRPGTRSPFGAVLHQLRQPRRVSQNRLSERAGFDHSYVSRLESGARLPTRDTVAALADALGVDADERDRLFVSGGFAVPALAALLDEPAVRAVAGLLVHGAMTDPLRDGLRDQLLGLATVYRLAATMTREDER